MVEVVSRELGRGQGQGEADKNHVSVSSVGLYSLY